MNSFEPLESIEILYTGAYRTSFRVDRGFQDLNYRWSQSPALTHVRALGESRGGVGIRFIGEGPGTRDREIVCLQRWQLCTSRLIFGLERFNLATATWKKV
eukprot:gb/GECG01000433.1/.p1 GENE.gb/GECG01000433.1/~~gb/GECG01000433.1/.p1  ORF type:complete len:101 (+),score=4.61 gb/GECG01000433.1/:1-303(+)